MKASADSNVSTGTPTDISRFLRDRRSEASSSTMQTTRALRLPIRDRRPSVRSESTCRDRSVPHGGRLPYLGRVFGPRRLADPAIPQTRDFIVGHRRAPGGRPNRAEAVTWGRPAPSERRLSEPPPRARETDMRLFSPAPPPRRGSCKSFNGTARSRRTRRNWRRGCRCATT